MGIELSTTSGTPQPPRPRRGGARPDPFPLLQGLDRIRDFVHQRLDRIEALSQERSSSGVISNRAGQGPTPQGIIAISFIWNVLSYCRVWPT